MAAFLTDEWFALVRDAAASWPAREGVDASLQFVVAGAPSGKLQFVVRVVEGRITEMARGKSDAVDCTVQLSCAHACALAQGTLDREVAYMRGDLKIDGNYTAYLLHLEPLFESIEFAATGQSLRERTEF
jgi:ubiquinone biosynthesis protein UbiJ